MINYLEVKDFHKSDSHKTLCSAGSKIIFVQQNTTRMLLCKAESANFVYFDTFNLLSSWRSAKSRHKTLLSLLFPPPRNTFALTSTEFLFPTQRIPRQPQNAAFSESSQGLIDIDIQSSVNACALFSTSGFLTSGPWTALQLFFLHPYALLARYARQSQRIPS